MYKRRAHLTFIAEDIELLMQAESLVNTVCSLWLSCAGVLVSPMQSIPVFTATDLVIILHRGGRLPVDYQGSLPRRYWELTGNRANVEQILRHHLESMMAGMRMLSRLDA